MFVYGVYYGRCSARKCLAHLTSVPCWIMTKASDMDTRSGTPLFEALNVFGCTAPSAAASCANKITSDQRIASQFTTKQRHELAMPVFIKSNDKGEMWQAEGIALR